MLRAITCLSCAILVLLVLHGCMGVVPLAPGYYPAILDTGEVHVIDARGMQRSQVERVLEQHHVIARFYVRLRQRADFEELLAEEVEKGKPKALDAGGNVLMLTDDSEMIAVIKQDARYAGALDAVTMYVMLRR